jgi:tetratricopeptide (TPR) repeat protein
LIPLVFVAAQAQQRTGSPKPAAKPRPAVTPQSSKPHSSLADEELNRRYGALKEAVNGGDPQATAAASRNVIALALRMAGNLRMLVGAYAPAQELYQKSLALEENQNTRVTLAIAAIRSDHPEEALEQTAIVTGTAPANATAWHIRAKAFMAKDDYRSAVDCLQRSLELKKDVNAQYALAFSLLKLGQKTEAEEVFRQMLDSYGDRAIWHVVFAGAYRDSKYMDDAIREFKRAVAIDPTVPNAQFYLGVTLLEQNHWAPSEESMAAFREAVRQNPKDYNANFYLGVGESQFQQFDSSNSHLKLAAAMHPETPEVWLYLGLNAFQQKDYPVAKADLLKAIELTGADDSQNNYQIRRAYIALGRMYFMEGNKEKAEKYVQRAKEMQAKSLANSAETIAETMESGGMGQGAAVMPHIKMAQPAAPTEDKEIDPTAPMDSSLLNRAPLAAGEQQQVQQIEKQLRQILSDSYNNWGVSQARQGLYAMAIEQFHEAERWDNSTAGLMRNIGLAALRQNDIPEALRALQVAVQVDSRDQVARSRLALIQYSASDYKAAAENFEALSAASYKDPNLAYPLAYSLVRINQQKKAIEVLNRLVTLDVPAEMMVSAGDLYGVVLDYERALSCYRKALQKDPSITKVHYKMGAALIRLTRPAEAIPELQIAARIAPDDPDVQYNLAYALLEVSEKAKAVAILRTIVTDHADYPQAHYQLGKILLEDGQLEESIQQLEIAAKLDPERDYVHYQLQTAYRRSGRKLDADREARIYKGIKSRKREQVTIPMANQQASPQESPQQ